MMDHTGAVLHLISKRSNQHCPNMPIIFSSLLNVTNRGKKNVVTRKEDPYYCVIADYSRTGWRIERIFILKSCAIWLIECHCDLKELGDQAVKTSDMSIRRGSERRVVLVPPAPHATINMLQYRSHMLWTVTQWPVGDLLVVIESDTYQARFWH